MKQPLRQPLKQPLKREVATSRQRSRIVIIPLLFVLVTQSSCCTLVGWSIGSVIDGGPTERGSEEFRRVAHQYPGEAMEVTMKDGRVVAGVREVSRRPTRAELREAYRALADHSSGAPRLPLPGDSILVSTATTRGWGLFDGFVGRRAGIGTDRLDTSRVVTALFATSGGAAPMTLPWSSIRRIQWADSSRVEDPHRLLPTLARVPASPRVITILTGSGGREEFRSWDAQAIETSRARNAKTIGLVTGLSIDGFLVYMVLHGLATMMPTG